MADEVGMIGPLSAMEAMLLCTGIAALAMPVGGWLAMVERIHPKWLEQWLMHGILYAVFADVAPGVKRKNHRLPSMGAVAGFLVGVTGNLWLTS